MDSVWAGPGTTWVNNLLWIARDLQVDAIVNYDMRGCTATLGLKKIVDDVVEKELGIPVLHVEGSQFDSSYASEATITAQLDEFAQMCLSKKGLV